MLTYRIVYPSGDRTKLTVCSVASSEEHEWALASRKVFDDTEDGLAEARRYGRDMARQFDKTYVADDRDDEPDFLD